MPDMPKSPCLQAPAGSLPLPASTGLSTVPSAAEAAGSRKGHVTPRAYRTENQTRS